MQRCMNWEQQAAEYLHKAEASDSPILREQYEAMAMLYLEIATSRRDWAARHRPVTLDADQYDARLRSSPSVGTSVH
jgi:hypothetical protein